MAANGERMLNEGQHHLRVATEDGSMVDMVFQVTAVKRPLCSAGEICDRGNRVTFGRGGGVITNLRTGKQTPFKRENGIYTIALWVKKGDGEQGFHRQG